jgi:predicted Zn-dependent protease
LKPDFALAWNRLGRVALKRGDLPAAVSAQQKARKLEPKNGSFAADLCRAFIEQKQAPRAVSECKAAVDLEPKNPLAHYELMKALVAKGDCAGAKSANASFKALPVKPEAKQSADAILATCKK